MSPAGKAVKQRVWSMRQIAPGISASGFATLAWQAREAASTLRFIPVTLMLRPWYTA